MDTKKNWNFTICGLVCVRVRDISISGTTLQEHQTEVAKMLEKSKYKTVHF
jgi:hypothetical protein